VVTTASTTTSVTTLGATTTFYGRGYGHGVGLSQYGARGRALAGQLAPEILAHYYAGTTIGSISTETGIRVLLLDNFGPTAVKPLTIYGRGGPWTFADLGIEFPADARLQLFPPASPAEPWRAVVDLAATQVLYDGPVPLDFRVRGTTDPSTIQLFSKPSTWDLFRGTLRVIVSGGSVDIVNELPLEAYLRGVVPAEMPTSWPVEARIAQTIVARSYAAYQLHPASGTFDVYDDTRSQVYLGVRQEKPDADAVIAATAGQVLLSGSSIANALFHSTAGGATENNENVFVSATGVRIAPPVSYLRGSSDRDPAGVPYDVGAPSAIWQTRAYTIDELSAIFARDSRTNVGTLTGLELRNRGVSGRLISVTLVGSLGARIVSGTVFVAAFNAGRASTEAAIRGTLVDVAPIP
jgi:SpoIID/LytB domain protein